MSRSPRKLGSLIRVFVIKPWPHFNAFRPDHAIDAIENPSFAKGVFMFIAWNSVHIEDFRILHFSHIIRENIDSHSPREHQST